VPKTGIPTLAKKALRRLKVKTEPSGAERAYTEGGSTQVPTGYFIAVRGRNLRRIGAAAVALERPA